MMFHDFTWFYCIFSILHGANHGLPGHNMVPNGFHRSIMFHAMARKPLRSSRASCRLLPGPTWASAFSCRLGSIRWGKKVGFWCAKKERKESALLHFTTLYYTLLIFNKYFTNKYFTNTFLMMIFWMIFLKSVTALHRWGVAGVEVSIEPRLTFDLQAGDRWGSLGIAGVCVVLVLDRLDRLDRLISRMIPLPTLYQSYQSYLAKLSIWLDAARQLSKAMS